MTARPGRRRGRPPLVGIVTQPCGCASCPGHRRRANELTLARKAEKRAQGLCVGCGKRRLATKNHCRVCADKAVASDRRWRVKRVASPPTEGQP